MYNFRYAGCSGNCCGICNFNQCDSQGEDICEKGITEFPLSYDSPYDQHVCDLFEIQPDSIRLSDLKVGDIIEHDIEIMETGFCYSVKQGERQYIVHKYAPLRGYKIVNP